MQGRCRRCGKDARLVGDEDGDEVDDVLRVGEVLERLHLLQGEG